MTEALRTLTEAADRFVASVPPSRKLNRERKALIEAITHAQQRLANERFP
jgi:hypothetical protein